MRLTRKDEKGNWRIGGYPWKRLREGRIITKLMEEIIYSALCKLKDYEDSSLTPEQIYNMDKTFSHMCNIVNNKWIPVGQRLPEIRKDCLVTVRYTGFMGMHGIWVKTGHMESENDWWGDCAGGEVIAWMPLTDPYRPEEGI